MKFVDLQCKGRNGIFRLHSVSFEKIDLNTFTINHWSVRRGKNPNCSLYGTPQDLMRFFGQTLRNVIYGNRTIVSHPPYNIMIGAEGHHFGSYGRQQSATNCLYGYNSFKDHYYVDISGRYANISYYSRQKQNLENFIRQMMGYMLENANMECKRTDCNVVPHIAEFVGIQTVERLCHTPIAPGLM